MLKIIGKNLISIIYLTFLTFVSFLIASPIYFATNDDGIMSKIANGSYSNVDNEVLIYSAQIFGKINKIFYNLYCGAEWYGVLQSLLILGVAYYFIYILLNKDKNNINNLLRFSLIIFISIIYMNFVTSPTFTVGSIILGISGLIVFIQSNITNEFKLLNYIIFFIFITFSYLLRPDGFILIIFLFLLSIFFLILFKILYINKINVSFFIIIVIFGLVVLSETNLNNHLKNEKYNWKQYLVKKDLISTIHTNPSNIEMNKMIDNKEINGLKWTSVESTLLQKLMIFDNSIYSNSNIGLGVKAVEKYQGLNGLQKYNFKIVLLRMIDYLKPVTLIILFYFVTLLFSILNIEKIMKFVLILLPVSYLGIFYYLSAVLRLPERVSIPLMTMSSFSILFLIYMNKEIKNSLRNWLFLILIPIFICTLPFTKYGFINNKIENQRKYLISNEIISKLGDINPKGIYIGDIEYSNENFKLSYIRENPNLPLQLTSGWITFSPHWVNRLQSLKLMGNNPLQAIAQQENVYWISNLYFSNVIDMFMNDHNILRKDRCELAKLPTDGYVITFQLTKSECVK